MSCVAGTRPQNSRDHLQRDRDREHAAEVMQAAFPRRLKRWGRSMYAISRARQDGGPLAQLSAWIRDGARAGMTMDEALMPVAHLMSVVRAEFGEALTFDQAALAEALHDADEDVAQMHAVLDRSKLSGFIVAGKKSVAALLAAIVAAEREVDVTARSRRSA